MCAELFRGSALFDVTHSEPQKFVVKTRPVDIAIVAARLRVDIENGTGRVRISVERGSIEVRRRSEGLPIQAIQIQAGEEQTFVPSDGEVVGQAVGRALEASAYE